MILKIHSYINFSEFLFTISIMNQNEKPHQFLAWIATSILIIAAILASFVPALEYHHLAFIIANSYGFMLDIYGKRCLL